MIPSACVTNLLMFFVSVKLKRLLAIVARSVPFKPNMSSLATMINAGRNNLV